MADSFVLFNDTDYLWSTLETNFTKNCTAGEFSDGTCKPVWPTWVEIGVPILCVVIFVLTLSVMFFAQNVVPPKVSKPKLTTMKPKKFRITLVEQNSSETERQAAQTELIALQQCT